jgi:hypothetical protein
MRAASAQEIKQELATVRPQQLMELCLRLSRFKKENKELLTYLLFEAQDEAGYINGIRKELDEIFAEINLSHLYYAKKTLRRIIRIINKYSRYSGKKETDVELRLHFLLRLKETGIPIRRNKPILNMYEAQLKKITASLKGIHEELARDYAKEMEKILEG